MTLTAIDLFLSFIAKVLEKVVSSRLNLYLNCNHLSNVFFSVCLQTISLYRNRSTKSSKRHMDTGKVTALTLLDLSAAFDTIDYSVLLDRLSD